MKALILAGGLGLRLRPLTDTVPKPMIQVADRPFLEYQIEFFKRFKINDIILCTGHLGEKIKGYFGDGKRLGVKIQYSEEKCLLGTGGAIKNAFKSNMLDSTFIVLNGDTFFNINLKELINFHNIKKATATIALTKIKYTEESGLVVINEKDEVEAFLEKSLNKPSNINTINGGIYVLEPSVFESIPEGNASIEREIFPALVGKRLYAKYMEGYFVDIGTPETLIDAQERLKDIVN